MRDCPIGLSLSNTGLSFVGVNLSDYLDSYQHTIVARGGFETCTLNLIVPLALATEILDNWLGYRLVCSSPDAETVWEGYLNTITARFGQEQVDLSLDTMGNRVTCKYTTVLGTPGATASDSNATSIARYGTKDLILSLSQTTSTAATQYRDTVLVDQAWPKARHTTTVATGDIGQIAVTLQFAGYYSMLDWLVTEDTDTSTAETTDQVKTLLTAYNSTNSIFSSDQTNIADSGVDDTQKIEADTTYRAAIEKLLRQGNSSQYRLAWGVYEDRKFWCQAWAPDYAPSLYTRSLLGDRNVYNQAWVRIEPWNVRPDTVYQIDDLIPLLADAGNDSTGQFYVERVTCSVTHDSITVNLEPTDTTGADVLLARLGG